MVTTSAAFECRGDYCYKVSLAPGTLFELRSGEQAPRKCYEAICETEAPCAACPLLAADPTRLRVLPPLKPHGPFRLLSSSLDPEQVATVTVRHLPEELVPEILNARVQAKADEALLSPREREVLEAVLLGQDNESIAGLLGISVRTVKFHQARLLAKLGAESKLDLFRVLL